MSVVSTPCLAALPRRRSLAAQHRVMGTRTLRPGFCARRAHGGFSLLEVIAAIMLLAIAFTALMKVAGSSISLTQNAADRSVAAMHARSLLDTVFVNEPVQAGVRSGTFDDRFSWQLDVTPWQPPGNRPASGAISLYQLDLQVSWGPAQRPRIAHFQTLRAAAATGGFLPP